ncbi:hypothetical protein Salat_1369500 [Sesamum alatum]|uniref:Uncharacterized protein n=1 Tax=Sesamum alatum TaxID=300844 RepID=A0AAE1Y919_9LAMI|nr:hypothetical protein Salat_1369500 [Sesamum alatum]
MADAAGGFRSYRDAVAGVTVSPPPPPISFDSASFRPMGTLTRDQGMKVLRFSDDEIEDDVFTQIGAGRVQMDDDDVSRRVASHRRGRSMEEDPSGASASPNYGQAASLPRRRVTRSMGASIGSLVLW